MDGLRLVPTVGVSCRLLLVLWMNKQIASENHRIISAEATYHSGCKKHSVLWTVIFARSLLLEIVPFVCIIMLVIPF